MSQMCIYIYGISLYYIYTVDKLLTRTMYEKMDGKGIHLWFLQSVRQSPGQAVFQPTCFQTSWDARGGLGTTIFEGICLLGTISTKTLEKQVQVV